MDPRAGAGVSVARSLYQGSDDLGSMLRAPHLMQALTLDPKLNRMWQDVRPKMHGLRDSGLCRGYG